MGNDAKEIQRSEREVQGVRGATAGLDACENLLDPTIEAIRRDQ